MTDAPMTVPVWSDAPELHLVPADGTARHDPDRSCRCGPVASFKELTTGATAWRHRNPPVEPEVPAFLRSTVAAYQGGAHTGPAVAAVLGITPRAAKFRLGVLRTTGVVGGGRQPGSTADVHHGRRGHTESRDHA